MIKKKPTAQEAHSTDANLADYAHPARVRRVLEAMAPVACPSDVEQLGLIADVVDHVELSMRALPPLVRTGLVTGVLAFDQAARVWPGNWGRSFVGLDRTKAERYFASWRRGTGLQKQFIQGVKGLLNLAYYEMPAVKQKLDFQPEAWIEKVSRRRLEVYQGDIDRHQQSLIEPDPLPPMRRRTARDEQAEQKEAG